MNQIAPSVFMEGGEKPRFKNHMQGPMVNGNGNMMKEHSPPPKLERITEGSIPISLIADRVIRKSYGEFLNLAETLPAMSDVPKKKRMLEYLLETRRQMIKLLVLVKWAKVSREVEQCIDVVHFLRGQRFCFNNVIVELQHVRHLLSGARLRNPDLRTAIDVLSTGNYPTFPNQLTSQFIPAVPITPTRALETLKSLNTLLHLRLTLHEVIPVPLSKYTVANGRVTFIVPNEWQLSVTITEEFGQWWFVDFRDHEGKEVGENMKRRVQQVVEEAFERCKVEYGLFPMGVTEEALKALKKRPPLVEVYNILHRFHLIHSLSTLHVSLQRLSLTPRFSPYLAIISSPNRDTVEFQYWIRTSATRQQAPRSHPVRLSIVNEEANLALEESIYHVPGSRIALDYERTKIAVRWIRDGVEVSEEEMKDLDLTNAESLVERVTKIHARTILQKIAGETEGITFWDNDELYFRLLDSSRRIRISVDLLAGRILLTEASNTSAMLLPPIIQQAQHNLSASLLPPPPSAPGQPVRRPPTAKESIFNARLSLLKSQITTLAEYKGWTPLRYGFGYIHKPDLDEFLPQKWGWDELLFLSLGKETIVIHVLARQGWIIDLQTLDDGPSLHVIWVEKIANVKIMDHKANWLDWLDGIQFFVRGRCAIYGIEKGLEKRGVKFNVLQPPSKPGTLASQLLLPLLSLKSKDLIPEQSSCWASDNLIVRAVVSGNEINTIWEGKVRHSPEVEQLLLSVGNADPLTFNAETKVFRLRFPLSEEATPDIIVGALFKRFLATEKILQLVKQAKAVQNRCSGDNVFRLQNFSLLGIECVYGVTGPDGVLWPVKILVGPRCDVLFRDDDPHERFKSFICGWYNGSGGNIGILVEYLHATLPLYSELMLLESSTPENPELESLYCLSVLPRSVTSARLYSPAGPYMLDMSLELFTSEEYAKWMAFTPAEAFSNQKYPVWHIVDVALNPDPPTLGDGQCVALPGLQDVWNQCGSLMGPKAHWVVPLGKGMLCDAHEGGRALKGIWGCVIDAIGNQNVAEAV